MGGKADAGVTVSLASRADMLHPWLIGMGRCLSLFASDNVQLVSVRRDSAP